MRILCLCPTYGRPRLVANALACFQRQVHGDKYMLILDDGHQIDSQHGDNWEVVGMPDRFPSLPMKYDWMIDYIGTCNFDAVVVWDDDDVYLPWHLSAIAHEYEKNPDAVWTHPYQVLSLYPDPNNPVLESAAGRFHGSLSIRTQLLLEIDRRYQSYWIPTKRADFDQQQIQACQKVGGDPLRPDTDFPPSYIFRWSSTGAAHCQALMKSPDDETWYHRYQKTEERIGQIQKLVPLMDGQTEHLINRYSYSVTTPTPK